MREGVFVVAIGIGVWVLFFVGLTGEGGSSNLPVAPAPTEFAASSSPTPAAVGTADATPGGLDDGGADGTPAGDGGSASSGEVYTIAAGDTLDRVAQRYGVTLEQLLAANPEITDPGRISVGQSINIPG